MRKARKHRRRPVRKPYREIAVRVPAPIADHISGWVGWFGRDEEEVMVFMLRHFAVEHAHSQLRAKELERQFSKERENGRCLPETLTEETT